MSNMRSYSKLKYVNKDDNIEILYEFPILWSGWECDYKGYVARHKNKTVLILSTHGTKYFADEIELEVKIAAYEQAIKATKKALEMLK